MPKAPLSDGGRGVRSDTAQARATNIRLLHLSAAAALILPLLLFSFASWISYRATHALADERIARSLDVMREQALKVFQSLNLAGDAIENVLGGRDEAQIEADEPRLREELRQMQRSLPEVQSIWVFGSDGHPQVITRQSPPPALDYSPEDYFAVPRDHPKAPYIGVIHASASGGEPYFTFNRARMRQGKFFGVIEMSLLPSNFSAFYAQLVSSPGLGFSLVREDGIILARFPALSGQVRLAESGGFRRFVSANAIGGFYNAFSQIDHTDHRVGVRRIDELPIYVSAFIQTAAIRSEWMRGMAMHLIFGIPATLFLFLTLLAVLRRTKHLYAETDQRLVAEERLRQAQRLDAIGQLTGGVAHDFNNLLTIILGNLEFAKRQLSEWTDGAHFKLQQRVENAIHGAQRAATVTKRLLAFARQQPLNPTEINVARLLTELSEFFQRALGEQISLQMVSAAGLWLAEADEAELEAALLNLTVNARDAMPAGGKLTIEASNAYLDELYVQEYQDIRPGQYVLIAVSDTGSGMPKEVMERAFEPFFTTKGSGQGTGLGLSQAYGFVKQSGGHIKIYSEPGEGTTVKMYLRRFAAMSVPTRRADLDVSRGRTGECILVVEDDDGVRSYLVETLRDLGYDVVDASGAQDALRLLEKHPSVSLLLTDVVMPETNGRTLAELARKQHPALKVLYMTGYSRNAVVHQGRLDPGVELIQKPLTREQVAAAVRKVLDAP